jgi:peptidoglycan hydrolase-like protein with peptidoglycan-binding domain
MLLKIQAIVNIRRCIYRHWAFSGPRIMNPKQPLSRPRSIGYTWVHGAGGSSMAAVGLMAALGAAGALILSELVVAGGLAEAALNRSDRCNAVLQAQRELARRTYDVGPLDGIFGAQTEGAVRRFQANQRLAVTGQISENTAIALGLPKAISCNSTAQGTSHRVATPGTSLNRRDRPSGQVLDQLADGASVVVVETQGGWSRLQQGGWVSSRFLSPTNLSAGVSAGVAPRPGSSASGGGSNNLYIPPSNGGITTAGTGATGGGGGGGGQPPATANPGKTSGACTHTALVTGSPGVNVRSAPAGALVSSLEQGQAICLTGEGKAASQRFWAKLQGGNWVAADFLRLLN